MPVDPQHRFKADFAGEVHHITHETKPIVFVDVRPVSINERRLAAFVSARNCLSSHCCCPSFLFFSCDPLITIRWDRCRRGAAAAAIEPGEKTKYLAVRHYNIRALYKNVTIRLPFEGKTQHDQIHTCCLRRRVSMCSTRRRAKTTKRANCYSRSEVQRHFSRRTERVSARV